MTKEYNINLKQGNSSTSKFDIRDYVEFDANGRAVCPNCGTEGGKKNLSVTNGGSYDGAYDCFKCHDTEAIREALGVPKRKILPTLLVNPSQAKSQTNKETKKKVLVSQDIILNDSAQLLTAQSKKAFEALKWLKARGILPEIAKEYKLGLARAKYDNKYYESISIPIPEEGKYYRKKRLIPWEKDNPIQKDRPWSQYGIPKMVYFSHLPKQAHQTWLCEGEWDAILLGWLVKNFQPEGIAVASFTCGCNVIPGQSELDRLPGQVKIFYDRNDELIKGKRAGEEGAKKVAQALGDRGEIALVPMPENCMLKGWDVSDALNSGYKFEEFEIAASQATCFKAYPDVPEQKQKTQSSLQRMSFEEIFDTAPDYCDWLLHDLLISDELSVLAAPPRAGKSLFALGLAKAVASGGNFLDRPVKKGKVFYVCVEDSQRKIKTRLKAQDWTREEMKAVEEIRNFTLDKLPELVELIKEEKPALVVIDTLSRVRSDANSESSAEMGKVLAPLQDIASENNCCVLVVHHTRKQGLITKESNEIFDSVRGSGAIRSTCRGMLVLLEEKGKFRLIAENGDAEKQNLEVRLNPNTLNWSAVREWKLNVNMSQKQKIFEYLKTVESASVEDIAEDTLIPTQSVYVVLARLRKEGVVRNSTKDRKLVQYYVEKKFLTVRDLLDNSDSYLESDTGDLTNFQKNQKSNVESDQEGNEMLRPLITFSRREEKNNFVRSEEKSSQPPIDIDVAGSNKHLTNSDLLDAKKTNVISGTCSHFSQSDHIGDVTKNFDGNVINPCKEEELKPGDKVKGCCTNTKIDDWIGTVESINREMANVEWSDGSQNLVGVDLLQKIE